ncbi:MAG: hypothetical protein KOO63_06585 [Bacteroidales bacterium]|nr:hypothetical protein [Candidatus Latescibacterota bacterium]
MFISSDKIYRFRHLFFTAKDLSAAFFLIVLMSISCTGRKGGIPVAEDISDCVVIPRTRNPVDTVLIGLPDPMNLKAAPFYRTLSERIVFSHLYETLITIDCSGKVRGVLAVSWKSMDGGKIWRFKLKRGITFVDGSRVKAEDIASSWSRPSMERFLDTAMIDSVTSTGDRSVLMHFSQPRRMFPGFLALPPFSVVKRSERSLWPAGTGPYMLLVPGLSSMNEILDREELARGSDIEDGELVAVPIRDDGLPVIRFIHTEANDGRDLLDRGVDLILTEDPDVIDYASRQDGLADIPLPWESVYLLLSTSRVNRLRWGEVSGSLSMDFCEKLARDAVSVDSRGRRAEYWWDRAEECGDLSGIVKWPPLALKGADSSAESLKIVYLSGQKTARELSERLVALISPATDRRPIGPELEDALPGLEGKVRIMAEGARRLEFNRRIGNGDDFAYIISLPLSSVDPCYQSRMIIGNVKWLSGLDSGLSDAILPLLETRPHIILRSGKMNLEISRSGIIRVVD